MRITGNDDWNLLVGTDEADQIYGLGGEDWLFGGDGNDLLVGGIGPDHLYGGNGIDTVDYRPSEMNPMLGPGMGVIVDLAPPGGASGYSSDGDHLFDIENVIGSRFNDWIDADYSTNTANTFWGWDGNDQLHGYGGSDVLYGGNGNDLLEGGSGPDTLYGEDGIDTADYSRSALGVSVDLAAGVDAFGQIYGFGSGGDAKNDVLYGIENLWGSSWGDQLFGDAAANVLIGDYGDDRLEGRDGTDTLLGGYGADTLVGGADADTFVWNLAGEASMSMPQVDMILDFDPKADHIDLHAIDANPDIPGDDAFTIGTGLLPALGEVTMSGEYLLFNSGSPEGIGMIQIVGITELDPSWLIL